MHAHTHHADDGLEWNVKISAENICNSIWWQRTVECEKRYANFPKWIKCRKTPAKGPCFFIALIRRSQFYCLRGPLNIIFALSLPAIVFAPKIRDICHFLECQATLPVSCCLEMGRRKSIKPIPPAGRIQKTRVAAFALDMWTEYFVVNYRALLSVELIHAIRHGHVWQFIQKARPFEWIAAVTTAAHRRQCN